MEALESGKPISAKTKQKLLSEEAEILDKIRQVRGLPPTIAREKKAMDRALMLKPIVEECEKEGATSLRLLAKCLNEKGIEPPKAKEWTHANVQTLKKQLKKISDMERG